MQRIYRLVLAFFTVFLSINAHAQICGISQKSPNSKVATTFTIKNTHNEPTNLYWIDLTGKFQFMAHLDTNASVTLNSFVGHLFAQYSEARLCLNPIITADLTIKADFAYASSGGLSLGGIPGKDICLAPKDGLACSSASAFTLMHSGDAGIAGYPDYSRYQKNTQVYYQTQQTSVTDEKYKDDKWDGTAYFNLVRSFNAMTFVVSRPEPQGMFLRCVLKHQTSLIPAGLDKMESLKTFYSNVLRNKIITIGAYTTTGVYIGFTRSSEVQNSLGYKLFALDLDKDYVLAANVNSTAGLLIHEILHNYGYGHQSNDLGNYDHREYAIHAAEDCMAETLGFYHREWWTVP